MRTMSAIACEMLRQGVKQRDPSVPRPPKEVFKRVHARRFNSNSAWCNGQTRDLAQESRNQDSTCEACDRARRVYIKRHAAWRVEYNG